MDMFRAVLRSNELSRRTLLLSEAVIDCNSANYSAWHFRRLCLERLGSDLNAELEWVATVALDTPKNYQSVDMTRCASAVQWSGCNSCACSFRLVRCFLMPIDDWCSGCGTTVAVFWTSWTIAVRFARCRSCS